MTVKRFSKYQNGGEYVARRDNTYVSPPVINEFIKRFSDAENQQEQEVDSKYDERNPYRENWRVHDEMEKFNNTKDEYRKTRRDEAIKYNIPYIRDKEIRLTKGRFNTGRISTNVLDSIYDAAQRTGISFQSALGLAGRESTLGIGRGFKRGNGVTATDLFSNWQQIDPYFISNKQMDRYNELLEKYNSQKALTNEEANEMIGFFNEFEKKKRFLRPIQEHPIDNALKLYAAGKYNPGDKRHTAMVEEDGRVLMTEPGIIDWLNKRIASSNNNYTAQAE